MITLKDLLNIPLFTSFQEDPGKLSALMRHGEILQYGADLKVLEEGQEDDGALYVVYEGSVGIAKMVDYQSRRAKNLGIIRTGEFFGEMTLLESAPKSATVYTLEPTTLIKISGRAFRELAATDVKLSSSLLFSLVRAISDRLRKTNTEVAILYDTGKILSSILDLTTMVSALMERVCSTLQFPSGCLVLYNELSGYFELIGSFGDASGFHEDLIYEIIREMKTKKHGIRYPDQDSLSAELEDRFGKSELLSAMAVPLFSQDRISGAMLFSFPNEGKTSNQGEFSDFEFHLVSGVAQQASFAVENARNRQEEAARIAYSRVKKNT